MNYRLTLLIQNDCRLILFQIEPVASSPVNRFDFLVFVVQTDAICTKFKDDVSLVTGLLTSEGYVS